MTKQYKAEFIVPIRASRILGEDGWEFESSERLSKNLCNHLIENLRVKFIEEYCDIIKYAGEGIRIKPVTTMPSYNACNDFYLTAIPAVITKNWLFKEIQIRVMQL